ncbi:hypothetical protein [Halobacterium yunchengense]|uniref:hypothetical protein n=1 Tax=Halobacterium yunchengense TaxID=3108497 RepID=UPI00300AF86A
MPAKTGASHGVAAFVTLMVGTTLSKFVWDLMPPLGEVSLLVVRALQSTTGASIPVTEEFAGSLVVMVGLSFLWGVVYHFSRHG